MILTDTHKDGIGVALNEATLLDLTFDTIRRSAVAVVSVLRLPAANAAPFADSRVTLTMTPVGRLALSLREGQWDDPLASVIPVHPNDISSVVRSFGALALYGWEYLDIDANEMAKWGDRLSLDWCSSETDGRGHSLSLFQEGQARHLDLCVWFDELHISDARGELSFEDFVADGQRWWEAFHRGDPRTQGLGLVPMK